MEAAAITAVATIVATVLSSCVSYLFTRKTLYLSEVQQLHSDLQMMIKLSIEYPYLESEQFITRWKRHKNSSKDEYLRYDVYCCIVFNFLARVSLHFKYDLDKIKKFIYIEEIVLQHREWWSSPPGAESGNSDGYSKEFQSIVSKVLNKSN